jgi:hypothetical protein
MKPTFNCYTFAGISAAKTIPPAKAIAGTTTHDGKSGQTCCIPPLDFRQARLLSAWLILFRS